MARHAFQAELYGLTQNQRNQGANAALTFLESEQVAEVEASTVDANRSIRGQIMLFVEATYSQQDSGDRMFDQVRSWAATRSEDAANGTHSYVRLRTVDTDARTITTRVAESPGWVESTSVDPLDSIV